MLNQYFNISDFINNYEIIRQETNKDNIALIDGDIFLYSVCFPKKQTEEQINTLGNQLERSLNDVIDELNKYLINTLIATNCVYYKGFLSGKSFRKEIDSEYKANRKDFEKPPFFNEVKQYLIDYWNFYQDKDTFYEADDLIASFNSYFTKNGYNTVIVTIDKDMDQLSGKHYNFRKKEFYDISPSQSEYLLWNQVIIGDSTDNIKGIEGVGKVGASNILLELPEPQYKFATLGAYVYKYGLLKGINNFTKNFNLIYLRNDFNIESLGGNKYDFIKTTINNIDSIRS